MYLLPDFQRFHVLSVSITAFEQVNVGWIKGEKNQHIGYTSTNTDTNQTNENKTVIKTGIRRWQKCL